jgi:branched-chain amino acid aminotransferase
LGSYAYFRKQIVPIEEANVNIMTHALNYGDRLLRGDPRNWNEEHEQVYLFRMRDHYERLKRSAASCGLI